MPIGDEELAKGREIVKILFDNVTFIPLYDSMQIFVRQPWVKDMDIPYNAGPIQWDYTNTWIEPH